MKDRYRERHIEDKRKRELNRTLALGNEGVGITETVPDNTAKTRVKHDITRERP